MRKIDLISVTGHIGHGKDTLAKVINKYLENTYNVQEAFEIKKFAGKLKQVVCIILGCTLEQLEDRTFKEADLGPEFSRYAFYRKGTRKPFSIVNSLQEAEGIKKIFKDGRIEIVPMTPRKFMQLLGTEFGREMIHQDIWVNALFKDRKPIYKGHEKEVDIFERYIHKACKTCGESFTGEKRQLCCQECIKDPSIILYPSWIITDTRMCNEIAAVKERGGLVLKIVNPNIPVNLSHESELAMTKIPDSQYDHIFINEGKSEEELYSLVSEYFSSQQFIFNL